jgi:chromosome partitioning protein
MNQKGGVGKTTTAVTIGSILAAEHRKKVLLVDLDPQGNLSDHLSIDPNETEKSIYDVIIGGLAPEAVMQKVHGLDVLPANIDLSGAEVELAGMMMRETRLKKALDPLADKYDYILLDCPPSLGLLTISGLTFAQQVIVPMQAEYLALRGLSQLIHTIGLVREHLNPELDVSGVVFCMYDGRTNLSRDVRAEVENHFPGRVYASVIRKNIRMAEAPSHGLPVNLYDPQCAGAQDYRAVVNELLSREGMQDKNPSCRQPLWKGDEARLAAAESETPE